MARNCNSGYLDANLAKDAPANLRPYIQALGEDGAEQLFLAFGGSQVYLPKNRKTTERSDLHKFLGAENTERLIDAMDGGGVYIKIPLASVWCAYRMYRRGISENKIARAVRSDVATVRDWINLTPAARQRRRAMKKFIVAQSDH